MIDLLVDHGCPFELKATESLADAHQCQLIQYLMLTGLTHGKLINFGMDCVDHRFVNCHETLEQRRKFQVERVDWLSSAYTDRLEHITVDLVQDWGTGLSRSLYKESLIALLGGGGPMSRIHSYKMEKCTNGAAIGVPCRAFYLVRDNVYQARS